MKLKDMVKLIPGLEGEGDEPVLYGNQDIPNADYENSVVEASGIVDTVAEASVATDNVIASEIIEDATDAKAVLTDIHPLTSSEDPVTQVFTQIAVESGYSLIGLIGLAETPEGRSPERVARVLTSLEKAVLQK